MQIVFEEAVRALERQEPCVLATVIRTKGSTPQKSGARLLVRGDGSGIGTLGGGCVEGDIWFAAKMLLRDRGDAEVKSYSLSEELAARDGLICGGTMYFLLEPIYEPGTFLSHAREVVDAYNGGKPVAIASIVRSSGKDCSVVGTRLLVREMGVAEGNLGSPELNEQVVRKARELMAFGKCAYFTTREGAEVFVEAHTTPPRLVLMGGGHVSKALAEIAVVLGFQIYVVDDREEFSNKERFPYALATVVGHYDSALAQVPINSNSYIVIATRGHRWDDMATEAALGTPASYVGLLGSRRKSILIIEAMFRKGIPEERIRSIRAPVGLDIGGRTPDEIAISIVSEILMVRLGGDGKPMKMAERLIDKAKEKAGAVGARD